MFWVEHQTKQVMFGDFFCVKDSITQVEPGEAVGMEPPERLQILVCVCNLTLPGPGSIYTQCMVGRVAFAISVITFLSPGV
jgi:hypothetical protein